VKRLAIALPLFVGVVAYLNTLANGFVLDDYHLLVENPAIRQFSTALLTHATVTGGGAFYRPLGLLGFVVEHALFGMSPAAFHLGSLLNHLMATAMVAWLALRAAGPRVALVAGVIFAAHPVHTEAVTGLANRPEVMATALYVAVLALEFSPLRARWRVLAQNVLFFAALLCKESAITLPLALALVTLYEHKRSPIRAALFLLPALAIYLVARHHALGALTYDPSFGYFQDQSTWVRALTVLKALVTYARLLVFPVVLSADYSRDAIADATGLEWRVLAGLALATAVVAIAIVGRKRAPRVALGVALFAVAMLPYLHLTPLGFLVAERYLYLPSVGLSLAAGAIVVALVERLARPWLGWVAFAVVASLLVLRTVDRNLDWRAPLILWERTVATVPQSGFAHANLGISAYWAGQRERAIAELRIAIAITPKRRDFQIALHQMIGQIERERPAAPRTPPRP
jgi:hypothetical protein